MEKVKPSGDEAVIGVYLQKTLKHCNGNRKMVCRERLKEERSSDC
jgi:hypothetical protein